MQTFINTPFTGINVVLTRPVGDTAPLRRQVIARGGTPVSLPGLSLRPVLDQEAVRRSLQDSFAADDWIFVSPAAVRFTFSILAQTKIPPQIRLFAIGSGTARVLQRYGMVVIVPAVHQDSEGLLALPELQNMPGRQVSIIGAAGGRGVLQKVLATRGAVIKEIHVYRRVAARLTRRHFLVLETTRAPCITLVSSGQALTHLSQMLPPHLFERLRTHMLVVSSERLAVQAHALGFEQVTIADSALPKDLLKGAAQALARHRL